MQTLRSFIFFSILFLPVTLLSEALFTNMNEATGQTTSWIVRSNVRYAHQFTAGSSATITTALSQVSSAQKYPSSTAIRIHSDSGDKVGSLLGTLSYVSIDESNVITYSGEVEIPEAGTYWFEIYPTTSIANHYYTTTASTSATGSAEGWTVKKDKVASGGDSVNWSYFTGTPYQYPKFSLSGTNNAVPDTQTITTLAAAVDLTASPWLTDSETTLDLSGATISDEGQNALEELTGLDEDLDSIDKSLITTLKLGGNTSVTTIPADIFSTFPNLETLELHGNTGLTTITAYAFNELSVTDLRLDGNTSLITLPKSGFYGLTVLGNLYLNDNTALTTINTSAFTELTMTGNLRLDGNTALTDIPTEALNGITVGGNLYLNNTGITSIEADAFSGLTVTGNLQINSNSNLTSIAENAFNGVIITEDLQIQSNTNLVSLNENAFSGIELSGTLSLTGNSSLSTIPTTILDSYFKGTSITGDIRLDDTAITVLEENAFKETVVSNDLRIDNNAALTTIPASALQKANITNDLRIDSTGVIKLSKDTFKDTIVGNNLNLSSNSALTEIEPRAFNNINVTGNIDLEGATALTRIPWCVFDLASITGLVKLDNSGITNALPEGDLKTMLVNGATRTQMKQLLRKNPSLAAPVKLQEYAEIVRLQNKSLGPANASTT